MNPWRVLWSSFWGCVVGYLAVDLLPHITIDAEWSWLGVRGDTHLAGWFWLSWVFLIYNAFFLLLSSALIVIDLLGIQLDSEC